MKGAAYIYFDVNIDVLESVQVQNKDSPVTDAGVQTMEKWCIITELTTPLKHTYINVVLL